MVLIFCFAPKDFLAVGEILITYTVFQLYFFFYKNAQPYIVKISILLSETVYIINMDI